MKIVHVYAKNIDMFVQAVKDTDIKLNASQDLNYLISSLQEFNARDVLGLIIFANPFTRKCVKLIQKFDQLYMFSPMPIIVVNNNASDLKARGYLRVKNSKLYILNCEDNSLSDIELSSIFTTLVAFSGEIYDLSIIPAENAKHNKVENKLQIKPEMSAQLKTLLESVGKETYYASSSDAGG